MRKPNQDELDAYFCNQIMKMPCLFLTNRETGELGTLAKDYMGDHKLAVYVRGARGGMSVVVKTYEYNTIAELYAEWDDLDESNVEIAISGCDGTTYIKMRVTDKEMDFLKRLAKESKEASTCQCEPTIEITELKNGKAIKE